MPSPPTSKRGRVRRFKKITSDESEVRRRGGPQRHSNNEVIVDLATLNQMAKDFRLQIRIRPFTASAKVFAAAVADEMLEFGSESMRFASPDEFAALTCTERSTFWRVLKELKTVVLTEKSPEGLFKVRLQVDTTAWEVEPYTVDAEASIIAARRTVIVLAQQPQSSDQTVMESIAGSTLNDARVDSNLRRIRDALQSKQFGQSQIATGEGRESQIATESPDSGPSDDKGTNSLNPSTIGTSAVQSQIATAGAGHDHGHVKEHASTMDHAKSRERAEDLLTRHIFPLFRPGNEEDDTHRRGWLRRLDEAPKLIEYAIEEAIQKRPHQGEMLASSNPIAYANRIYVANVQDRTWRPCAPK